MSNDALIVGVAMVVGAIIGAGVLSILMLSDIEYKDTSTRHGECVVQERVCEPAFRLVCKRFYVEDIPDCTPVFWFADALEFT